jgi:hypothetical protein
MIKVSEILVVISPKLEGVREKWSSQNILCDFSQRDLERKGE